MASHSNAGLATQAIHADQYLSGPEVAPAISTSTTFRHPTLDQIAAADDGYFDKNWDPAEPSRHIYSRETQPITTRAEHVLAAVIGHPTVVYPSGIAAFFAILLHVRPDVIAITDGYHGSHVGIDLYRRTRGEDRVTVIKLDDEYPSGKKLLCWVETPLNPFGESRSIAKYAEKTHAVGGVVGVDSTFAPPPLSDPFKWGADIVMHSGTKYFAGHSDALIGTVSVRDKADWVKLWEDRMATGSVAGSLDSWLLLRSLRTLPLRIKRQARTATALASWLATLQGGGVIEKVWHASLQEDAAELLGPGKQMEDGPACFSVLLKERKQADKFPEELKYFVHATSLGGVESLIEQRIISDAKCDPRLLRLSIGVEEFEDLKSDLSQVIEKVKTLQ
ncbi:putative trans-sulfuration enzyme [Rhodotorula toruloides]|uniref:Cystathionine gamma-synthase n=1 Tax=Rhodotorula toruloides TaxID=5286 RepID=A0A2T0A462_RHOTO|nr:putative trans-sulfuration enzyme [Rhodotorula toruloides]PRQ72801.1 cystathionine gamma-synthase [Rhodotorula toruloides]